MNAIGFSQQTTGFPVECSRFLVARLRLSCDRAPQGDIAQSLNAVSFSKYAARLAVKRQRFLVTYLSLFVSARPQRERRPTCKHNWLPPANRLPDGKVATLPP